MLTREQRDQFQECGFVRISGAFSRAEAAAMEERVWAALGHRFGVCRDDPTTWKTPLSVGLQRLRRHAAFQPIGGDVTCGALDDLLGKGGWERPKHWGQFLVTFPAEDATWDVPCKLWHTDFPYRTPSDRIHGVLMFSFLAEVPPRTGATMVIEGSHRVVRRFLEARPKLAGSGTKMRVVRRALMASDPWLRDLSAEEDSPGRIERFMGAGAEIGDVPVRVVELTGEPGDVVLGHPWLLHSGSQNCGDRPRMMLVQRIRRTA